MNDLKAKMYQMKQNQMRNSPNITSETKPDKKPTKMSACIQALWAENVALHVGTITSREQFKPIRIRENLVVDN